jgi:hypothetical protein
MTVVGLCLSFVGSFIIGAWMWGIRIKKDKERTDIYVWPKLYLLDKLGKRVGIVLFCSGFLFQFLGYWFPQTI